MTYPIGTPGQPWGPRHRATWRNSQSMKRSFADDIQPRIEALRDRFEVVRYGALPYPGGPYPLLALLSRDAGASLPTALITGGVHGYETSGVLGALRFAEEAAPAWEGRARLAIVPCVSPWGYEIVNRWNPDALDPNRHFVADSPAEECRALMEWVESLGEVQVHVDLHETTDSDNEEFRPAKAARDGETLELTPIPDGFYLVGRTDRPAPAFQAAVRDAVAEVTHIAEADDDGCLIGVPLSAPGIIHYDAVGLGLCMGMTDAPFTTTTEVYPDSPRTDAATCERAQVAAVQAALSFALTPTTPG